MFEMDNLKNSFMPGMQDINLKVTVEKMVIEDIIVVNSRNRDDIKVPDGYEKIDVDLNENAGGEYIYFCIKRGTDENKAINSIHFAVGRKENVGIPAGYNKINVDLNKKAGGRYIYLCIRRGKENPIHDIRVVSSKDKNAAAPEGFTKINQDLNEGAGGRYIYLCYA